MKKANKQYQEMASVFGADFEPEEDTAVVAGVPAKTIDELKNELAVKTTTDDVITPVVKIQDEDYIKNELRIGAEMLTDAAEMLRNSLTGEDRPSKWEAFSNLMKERRETLMSLEQVNHKTYERNKEISSEDTNNPISNVTNNLVFTSSDALELILQAKNGLNPENEVK